MRFRIIYLLFIGTCVFFFYPFFLDKPLKVVGLFGGGRGEREGIFSDEDVRILFHVTSFVTMVLAGWFSFLSAIKDNWTVRGCISSHKYSFPIGEANSFIVRRIKGRGLTLIDVTACHLGNSKADSEEICVIISIERVGQYKKSLYTMLRSKKDAEPRRIVIWDKGDWRGLLTVCWAEEIESSQKCEIELKSYSGAGRPVSLFDFTEDTA